MIRKGKEGRRKEVEKLKKCATTEEEEFEREGKGRGGMVDHHHQGEKAPRSVAAPSWRRENSKDKE